MQTRGLTSDDQSSYHRRSKRSRTYDGSDSDVEIIQAPTRKPCSMSRAAEKYELGAEEGFVITHETGEVWNKHLPHSRAQCGVHPFEEKPFKTPIAKRPYWNARYCSQCYCYICDVPASTCLHWGTGGHKIDHCNAHSGSSFYRIWREMRQAAVAPPPTPPQSVLSRQAVRPLS